MRMKILKLLPTLLLALLLAGCGMSGLEGEAAPEPTPEPKEFSGVITAQGLKKLEEMPGLRTADLSGSTCYAEMMAWAAEHPEVKVIYTVPLPDGTAVPNDTEGLDLSGYSAAQMKDTWELLGYLPRLRLLRLGEEPLEPETLALLRRSLPEAELQGSVRFADQKLTLGRSGLSLPNLDGEQLRELTELLPLMDGLEEVNLGREAAEGDTDWEAMGELCSALPDLKIHYVFSVYGKECSLEDTDLDLSFIRIYDEGQSLRPILPCMRDLKTLDMEHCEVSDDAMGALREDFPEIQIDWRIYFGTCYSVRTDAIKILASKPTVGGDLMREDLEVLKYCTKLKYLDLGHNEMLTDISFISYMPELEVAILAMDKWTDGSPLADCPNLEFLEVQTTNLKNLTPLSGLTKLRHLNICRLEELTDLSPIYDLDLERLWIGCVTPIPPEQVEHYQRLHPNCKINTEAFDPHDGWRWLGYDDDLNPIRDPRYDLLVQQFGYDKGDYSFVWFTDPSYVSDVLWEYGGDFESTTDDDGGSSGGGGYVDYGGSGSSEGGSGGGETGGGGGSGDSGGGDSGGGAPDPGDGGVVVIEP